MNLIHKDIDIFILMLVVGLIIYGVSHIQKEVHQAVISSKVKALIYFGDFLLLMVMSYLAYQWDDLIGVGMVIILDEFLLIALYHFIYLKQRSVDASFSRYPAMA